MTGRLRILIGLLIASAAAGCGSRQVYPHENVAKVRETAQVCMPPVTPVAFIEPARTAKSVLILSGGGMYGAYTAGFLHGWTQANTRPEFDIVTGVSTGSLIGVAAFLGPSFDPLAREFYTTVTAAEIYSVRTWVTIPFSSSVASNAPLKHLIDTVIDDRILNAVAAEHRRGRRYYVATTNLVTRRPVLWDMGAVACQDGPAAATKFRDILLASCAVPGMLPPVLLPGEQNGGPVIELHGDGGITTQLFIPPGVIAPAADGTASGTQVYLMVAGKLFADPGPVKPKVLRVLAASAPSVLYATCRSEIANIYHLCRLAGADFHLTALPDSDNGRPLGLIFEPKEMSRLYEVGYCNGIGGPLWMTAPPFESAVTDGPRQ